MKFQLTNKDKKLLAFLAVFLILVGGLVLLIMPAMDKLNDLDVQIQDAQMTQDTMATAIAGIPSMDAQYEQLLESSRETLQDYYPIMNSQEIDREITGIVVNHQLEAVSLNIAMDEDGMKLEPYYASELAANDADSTADAAADSTADSTATYSTTTDSTAADSGEEAAENSYSTLSAARINLSVSGNRDRLNGLLDNIFRQYPGLHVNSFGFSAANEEDVSILNLDLELYMCDKEN